MKIDNENVKKETKDFRIKLDGASKKVINLIDGGVLRCNQYTDSRINDFHVILDNKIKEINDKLMDIRMKNVQSQNKFEESINNLRNEIDERMIKQKEEINQIIDKKIEYSNLNNMNNTNYLSSEQNQNPNQKIIENVR